MDKKQRIDYDAVTSENYEDFLICPYCESKILLSAIFTHGRAPLCASCKRTGTAYIEWQDEKLQYNPGDGPLWVKEDEA